jgi:7-carboxy-7-deazaguanine synthase
VPALRVTGIFHRIQGKSLSAGEHTAFVCVTGCPLRCGYCDTADALTGGLAMTVDAVLARVAGFDVPHVCVTGGEPLAQPACPKLLWALCDAGHAFSLETSGAMDVADADPRVIEMLDLETPTSGQSNRNLWSNLQHLTPRNQIKIAICDEVDYRQAEARTPRARRPCTAPASSDSRAGRDAGRANRDR